MQISVTVLPADKPTLECNSNTLSMQMTFCYYLELHAHATFVWQGPAWWAAGKQTEADPIDGASCTDAQIPG